VTDVGRIISASLMTIGEKLGLYEALPNNLRGSGSARSQSRPRAREGERSSKSPVVAQAVGARGERPTANAFGMVYAIATQHTLAMLYGRLPTECRGRPIRLRPSGLACIGVGRSVRVVRADRKRRAEGGHGIQ
jgi:hypothetical protein